MIKQYFTFLIIILFLQITLQAKTIQVRNNDFSELESIAAEQVTQILFYESDPNNLSQETYATFKRCNRVHIRSSYLSSIPRNLTWIPY